MTRSEGDVLQDGGQLVCKLCMVDLMDIRPKAKRVWLPEYVCTGILAKHFYFGGAVPGSCWCHISYTDIVPLFHVSKCHRFCVFDPKLHVLF